MNDDTKRRALKVHLLSLHIDLEMLREGSWVPDRHSCDASLDTIAHIKDILVELKVIKDFDLEGNDV